MHLSHMAFIMLRYIPFIPTFEIFLKIINGCWILSNAFFASIEMIIQILSFILLMWITLIDLWMLNLLCIPGINPTQSHWSFWTITEFGLLIFHWGFLHLCSWEILVCNFLFCVVFGFSIRVMLAPQWLEIYSILFNLLEELCRICIVS